MSARAFTRLPPGERYRARDLCAECDAPLDPLDSHETRIGGQRCRICGECYAQDGAAADTMEESKGEV